MLISKYGFFDVLEPKTVVLDPFRVAAQIVSGIGFIGAGLIFVRRDSVRGLTTAAGVWLTAAIGAACGASLPVLRRVLAVCTSRDFKVAVALEVHGGGSVAALAAELGEIDGVLSVAAGDVNEMFD